MENHIISQHYAKRVGLNQKQLMKALELISNAFNLGNITYLYGTEDGYEDVNIEIKTDKGHFLFKILINFLTKTARSVKDSEYYVHVMKEFTRGGIRVPRLYQTNDKNELYELEFSGKKLRVIVMEFFNGNHFLKIPPTIEDMKNIAKIQAKLHSLDLTLRKRVYEDTWQPQSLNLHHPTHKNIFTDDDNKFFELTINKLNNIDFSRYKKVPIHGDLMRNNIMKNKEGEYCLLDFGVVAKNHWIIDLALFMAGFCLDPTKKDDINVKIYKEVVKSYKKHNPVDFDFTSDLYTLVSASYAAFYLAATIEKNVENNLSAENQYWIDFGGKGIEMIGKLKKILI